MREPRSGSSAPPTQATAYQSHRTSSTETWSRKDRGGMPVGTARPVSPRRAAGVGRVATEAPSTPPPARPPGSVLLVPLEGEHPQPRAALGLQLSRPLLPRGGEADHERVLTGAGIVCSMSGVGQCWDNAPVESFFGRLKCEVGIAPGAMFATREEAPAVIFEYLDEPVSSRGRPSRKVGGPERGRLGSGHRSRRPDGPRGRDGPCGRASATPSMVRVFTTRRSAGVSGRPAPAGGLSLIHI